MSTQARTVIAHVVCLNAENERCSLREALKSQAAKTESNSSSSSEQNPGFRRVITPEANLGSPAQAEVVFSIDAVSVSSVGEEREQAGKLYLVVAFAGTITTTTTTASPNASSPDSSRPVTQDELVHGLKHQNVLKDIITWTDIGDTMGDDEDRFDQDTFHVLAGHRNRLIDGLSSIEVDLGYRKDGPVGFRLPRRRSGGMNCEARTSLWLTKPQEEGLSYDGNDQAQAVEQL
jgi:hypothetical protein